MKTITPVFAPTGAPAMLLAMTRILSTICPTRPALLALGLVAASLSGCSRATIRGTRVADTSKNRAVVDVIRKIEAAFEQGDSSSLMAHIDEDYFETMGTSDPSDDYDYTTLRDDVLPQLFATVDRGQVQYEVYDIEFKGDHAWADVRHDSRAALDLPSGEKWASERDFSRMTFKRSKSGWKLVSGL